MEKHRLWTSTNIIKHLLYTKNSSKHLYFTLITMLKGKYFGYTILKL